jgi:N6-L-threonylcarbamoyladenine synthase
MKAILAFDTSCYTTSVCLVGIDGDIIAHERTLLRVKEGTRGLRQSEGVFQHVENMPELIDRLPEAEIVGVCASIKPRPCEGSYMPVFTVGSSFGKSAASLWDVPFYETTHQEGHVMAGIRSCGWTPQGRFLCLHLSGGTTELLSVTPTGDGFDIAVTGQGADLHAGQLIDRVGITLGYPFPSGRYMDGAALGYAEKGEAIPLIKTTLDGSDIHLSGAEAGAQRLIEAGTAKEAVAAAVLDTLTRMVDKWVWRVVQKTGCYEVLLAGGVSASAYMRRYLPMRLEKRSREIDIYFAKPEWSTDNAMGVAHLGLLQYLGDGRK